MGAGKYSRWDDGYRVIFTEASELSHATEKQIDELFDELESIARARPEPPFVVACWRNASFATTAAAEHYGCRTARLLECVRAVVRYGADDPITRSMVRTEMMKHRDAGTRSNFVATREEALAAVRQLEAEQRTKH